MLRLHVCFRYFLILYVFEANESFSIVSQNYHLRVALKIQVNFRFYMFSRVLMIGSNRFW